MSNTLPALLKQSSEIAMALIESGGELTPELEIATEENKEALAIKIDGYGYIMDELDARHEFISHRIAQLNKILDSIDRSQTQMLSRVHHAMDVLMVDELSGNETRFAKQLNPPSLKFSETSLVPESYLVQKPAPPPTLDNAAIKKDLMAGIEVPGAYLERGVSIRRKIATAGAKKKSKAVAV